MNSKERQPRQLGWRFFALGIVLAILISALVRTLWVDVYYIPSASMEPLLDSGDRMLVSRVDFASQGIQRQDVVVFDGRGSFAPLNSGRGQLSDAFSSLGQWLGVSGSDTVYVKRVIGLPGDHVICCNNAGKITVNSVPLDEPYLYPSDQPSREKFNVIVPANRLWLMGDHRSVSADSRSLLGAPGGGMVPESRVIGRPISIIWPLDRLTTLPRTQSADATTKDGH
ncbi:signal peptidase I [Pseudarthrobacter sp. J1738]|uniref:signal peptidase I n=1 Tax=unclassified Pseudarthrobacter TaxID=2647000 RepID=UPI003D269B2E